MAKGRGKGKPSRKRVDFRSNRLRPARRKDWTADSDQAASDIEDAATRESVRTRGELSRKRTLSDASPEATGIPGTAIAVRGAYVQVEVQGEIWQCSIRRVLRTMRITERQAVVVGDQVRFSPIRTADQDAREGVITEVLPRRTALHRSDGRRDHVIAANVDQVLLVSSIREPTIKAHLIDRYLVAAHAAGLPAVVCINKVDLDQDGEAEDLLALYSGLGYATLASSTADGRGLQQLRELLTGKATLLAGQSGVGKSSLINAVQPGLELKTATVSRLNEKGRHTTTTAHWHPLDFGGAVVDTPGIRALEVAMVPINELEAHFVEFIDRLAGCKFANCIHIHENGCAIKAAVDAGEIDPRRYFSYVQLFTERSEQS